MFSKVLLGVFDRIFGKRFFRIYKTFTKWEKNVKNVKTNKNVKTAQNCRNVAKMLSCRRRENRG